MAQSPTEFFESIIEDINVPEMQVKLFFLQAYYEHNEDPREQLRLMDLLVRHRPEVESPAMHNIILGWP